MNHYEQLGVKPAATAGEIKRAYRGKAREKHPDKGGTAEEFAPVARAYEVLSDPNRRRLYDATGQDQRTPIEKEVQTILLTLFNEALSAPEDIEVIAYVREKVKTGGHKLVEEGKKLKERRKKLEAKRGKIKSTSTMNLAHIVIDGELKAIDAALAHVDHEQQLQKAMLAELKTYSEDWKAPAPKLVNEYQLIYQDPFVFRL